MTMDELTEKAKNLEEELQYRIEDFEGLNRPARVTEVRVLEPYPRSSRCRRAVVPIHRAAAGCQHQGLPAMSLPVEFCR
jgi:hypothetical protein